MRPSNAGERLAEAVRQAAGWGVRAAVCPACGHVSPDPPHRDGGPAEEEKAIALKPCTVQCDDPGVPTMSWSQAL